MGFWSTDRNVTLPIFGYIARNSKRLEPGHAPGWLAAEEGLCAKYAPYFEHLNESHFNQAIEYMRCTFDLGRTPMGLGYKVFLFLLIAAEAYGFSLLLAGILNFDASEKILERLALLLVFVLATLCAVVMHKAGEERYRTNLIRSCFKKYRETGAKDYVSRGVALNEDQSGDRGDPAYLRCLNRVVENPHDTGRTFWTKLAFALVVLIAVTSSVLRYEKLREIHDRQTQIHQQDLGSDAFRPTLPQTLTAPESDADSRIDKDIWVHQLFEGLAGIVMLGFIFIVTQAVGFMGGYQHSFAGKETYTNAEGANSSWFWKRKDGAYVTTGGFSTFTSYKRIFQPLKDRVNVRLRRLQHLLQQATDQNIRPDHTFQGYLKLQRDKDQQEADESARDDARRQQRTVEAS